MNDVNDLIADARKARVQESVFPIHTRMLDALETQRDRIAELEAELEEESGRANDEHLNYMRSDRGRSELAVVIEKVREWHNDIHGRAIRQSDIDNLHRLLGAVPADLLREHDADVWDAALRAYGDMLWDGDSDGVVNPYRVTPEDER